MALSIFSLASSSRISPCNDYFLTKNPHLFAFFHFSTLNILAGPTDTTPNGNELIIRLLTAIPRRERRRPYVEGQAGWQTP